VQLVVAPLGTRQATLVASGNAARAVRAAVSVPSLMSPGELGSNKAHSAGQFRPFPISEAKAMNQGGPVVVVDVLSGSQPSEQSEKSTTEKDLAASLSAAARQAAGELKDADIVIHPDMKGIDYLDFQKRNDAVFRGKRAAVGQLDAIKHLVGMPQAGSGTIQ
jgi:NTE family protein